MPPAGTILTSSTTVNTVAIRRSSLASFVPEVFRDEVLHPWHWNALENLDRRAGHAEVGVVFHERDSIFGGGGLDEGVAGDGGFGWAAGQGS